MPLLEPKPVVDVPDLRRHERRWSGCARLSRRPAGSLADIVAMTVFITDTRPQR